MVEKDAAPMHTLSEADRLLLVGCTMVIARAAAFATLGAPLSAEVMRLRQASLDEAQRALLEMAGLPRPEADRS